MDLVVVDICEDDDEEQAEAAPLGQENDSERLCVANNGFNVASLPHAAIASDAIQTSARPRHTQQCHCHTQPLLPPQDIHSSLHSPRIRFPHKLHRLFQHKPILLKDPYASLVPNIRINNNMAYTYPRYHPIFDDGADRGSHDPSAMV